MSPATVQYAKAGDVHVAYQARGEGDVDLLLVPDGVIPLASMSEDSSIGRFIRGLERFARVIRFDRRGTGSSDPASREHPPGLEQWVADAEAVLDAVGSDRTALLGMAEGGFVTSLLAASRPERAAALVLVNGTPGISAEPFRQWGSAASTIAILHDTVDSEWGRVDFGIPRFAPSAVGDERFREWLELGMRTSLAPAAADALFDVLFLSDIRDVLPAIHVPTLVIHRAGNTYLTPEHGRYLADHIDGARYLEVDGVDHVPYVGDQRPIVEAIEEFLTGGLGARRVDRVLATVLFTDIVDSTARAAELGDARWAELIAEHHQAVRREFERFAGREVDTAGDGFFATFDGPARAVRCACAITTAVRVLGIEIRAGIHTGEVELAEGKPAGIAVVIGSRVAAIGGRGEVLATSTVRDLVAGSGLRFVDRGEHELKGVPDPWRVFAVDPTSAV